MKFIDVQNVIVLGQTHEHKTMFM